ncbi:antitoxin [uncultured Thiothrix sp.]|uniref:antitoxin n=1 Tax=uncultured Thiothrix sp. TaxID=223185 RepID=UPI00262CE069|nr:type II toxin-antitoxin system VapB family antitoxin [uncultured Thiothrix sp.]HMT94732.1 type II toxin-antitoxin system VapB family antitoxin [Thiolinea sp.]
MQTTRVFMSGNSQAVRIPKEFQFDVEEIEIFKRGDEIILRKRPRNLAEAFEHIPCMPEDFMADGREQEIQQEREDWT